MSDSLLTLNLPPFAGYCIHLRTAWVIIFHHMLLASVWHPRPPAPTLPQVLVQLLTVGHSLIVRSPWRPSLQVPTPGPEERKSSRIRDEGWSRPASSLMPQSGPSQGLQSAPETPRGMAPTSSSASRGVVLEKMGWSKKVTVEGRESHWRWGQ